MKKILKKNKMIILFIIIFAIISITSIYSFSNYTTNNILAIKQLIIYILSFCLIYIINKITSNKIIRYSKQIYIVNVILLILVLLFSKEINGIKAWFQIPFIGSFQPSEFMKIGLILYGSKIVEESKIKNLKTELNLIFKLLILTLIPSVLTFLEPDTGSVIIYIIIFLALLYTSNIRNRWFIVFFIIFISILSSIIYLYIYQKDLFINIFGNTLFYRLDRIFDFISAKGMQLENSLIIIGSSKLIRNGILNIPIYYPEGQTDFIFTTFLSTFGIIPAIILIILFLLFDFIFINKAKKDETIYKHITFAFIMVIIFQQIENISMTIGLTPIIGITLPFISYGGSSLISFMILLGIILNKEKE